LQKRTKSYRAKWIYQRLLERRIKIYRARWTYRRIKDWIEPGDRVLNLGAGDCRLDFLVRENGPGEIVSMDVDDFNETSLKLTLYDGLHIPFQDESFDVVLLIFILHHAKEPDKVLREAKRVTRKRIVVFEDVIDNWLNRRQFRLFHRFLRWNQDIPLPYHEKSMRQWRELATRLELKERNCKFIGPQMSFFNTRNCRFVWEKLNR